MRSKLEEYTAAMLIENNISFQYEPSKVVLMEGTMYPSWEKYGKKFIYNTRKMTPITYTPDFVGNGWVIETKGFERESSKLKWKLYKNYLSKLNSDIKLFKPRNTKEVDLCIKLIKEHINEKTQNY